MNAVFIHIYHWVKQHKKAFFFCLILFVSACIYLATLIPFHEDITKILPKDENTETVTKVFKQLNFSDKIVVMIKAKSHDNVDDLGKIATAFIDTLRSDSSYYSSIQGEIKSENINNIFSFVHQHLPLFLDSSDYEKINGKIQADSIQTIIKNDYKSLISPSGIVTRDFILKSPLGFSFIGLKKLRQLGIAKDFIINNGFISTKDSTTLLIFITPKYSGTDSKHNEAFVEDLYEIQKYINQKYKEVGQLTYFGSSFVAVANAHQIKSDIQHTVFYSLIVLFVLLILFYRRIYVPFILFIPAICGVAVAFLVLFLMQHPISAISIGTGAILIGITVDYPLYIITHYRENKNINHLFKSVAEPILSSSLATSVAFSCLTLLHSEILRDLGIFAAVSVFASAVFSLLIIPHLYLPRLGVRKTIIDQFSAHKFEKNKLLIGIAILAVVFGFFTFNRVKFDSNISDLNYMPQNMQQSLNQLNNLGTLGAKSIYVTVYGKNEDSVLTQNHRLEQKMEELKSEGLIESYSSIGKFFLSKNLQEKKFALWNRFWTPSKIDSTILRVNKSAQELGFKPSTFNSLTHQLNKEFQTVTIKEYKSLKPLAVHQFYTNKDGFITLSSIVKTDSIHRSAVIDALSEEHVIPIDRKEMSERFLGQIKDGFKSLINYSYLAVFLILLLFFRRAEVVMLVIVPITLTGFAVAGFVYLFGLEFNVFSTVVTTLILGLGVDYSIFITSGLQKKYTIGKDELKIYRASICMAILTTLLSLGVLVFAKHPALQSISLISVIGLLSAMFITFALYPLMYNFFFTSRQKKGKTPVTLRLYLFSIVSFSYYFLGSMLLFLFGWVYIKLFPGEKEKKLYHYRSAIGSFLKSVLYSNYGVKNQFRNPHNETFEKPAIIIANHSSFLDTLAMGFMKTPVIFLVKDHVYHNPIYGKTIQLAGYYHVGEGIRQGEERLTKLVEKGYSIVVFPEGTRSKTNDIGRFHKGGFHLAKKYKIDLLPVYIHGTSDVSPKGDYMVLDGVNTIEIGKRISIDDVIQKEELRDFTKRMSKDFKNHFQTLRDELEDEDYFKHKIRLSFLYKTKEVKKRASQEFEEVKKRYYDINKHLPKNGKILRVANDLGIPDLILTLQQAKRQLFTSISDMDKRNIAHQNYLTKIRKIKYVDTLSIEQKIDVLLVDCEVKEADLWTLIKEQEFSKIIIPSALFKNLYLKNSKYTKTDNTGFFTILQ